MPDNENTKRVPQAFYYFDTVDVEIEAALQSTDKHVCLASNDYAWKAACTHYLAVLSYINGGDWVEGRSIGACFPQYCCDVKQERLLMRQWLFRYFQNALSPISLSPEKELTK